MQKMIYRSPPARWFFATGATLGGLSLTLGDQHKWQDTPSLHWLAGLGVPLQVWGAFAFVYAAMILTNRFRAAGFLLGAGLFALFAVSLFATLGDGGPKNAMVAVGLADVVVFHVYAVIVAYDDTPRRHNQAPK